MATNALNNPSAKTHHNRYYPETFLDTKPERGVIRLDDGQRAVRVSEAFINGLHLGCEEEVGESSGLVMYQCGYQWGLKDMKRFNERMRHEYGGGKKDIWDMNLRFVFESWWWPLTLQGFGSWYLDLSFSHKNLTVVELRNSAVAQSIEVANRPVCHLYAGLFAGVFSFYDRQPREAVEIQCYAMGNDVCKFLVGDKSNVNAADFWVEQGVPAVEIMANFD